MRLPTLTSKSSTVTSMSPAATLSVSRPLKRVSAALLNTVPVPPSEKVALLSRANVTVAFDWWPNTTEPAPKPLPAVAWRVLPEPAKSIDEPRPSVSRAFSATVAVLPDWMLRPANPSTAPRLQLLLALVMLLLPPTSRPSVVKSKVSSLIVAPPPAVIARLAAETPPATPITCPPLFRCTVVAPVLMSLSNTRLPPSLRPTSSVAASTSPIEALLSPEPRCSSLDAVDWRMVTLPAPLLAVTALPMLMLSPVRITSPVVERLPSEMSTLRLTSSKLPVALKP